MPNKSQYEILLDIWELLNLTLTLTFIRNRRNKYQINKHLRTKLCEIAQALWRRCKLFGTVSYLILHRITMAVVG